uniref:Uncharacterized protein n=1 Tax=Panagrolaimus sp. JU765 TaxID=591449 RepID=A0AC34R1H7_9BILA
MLTRHLVFVLIVLFFVGPNVQINGAKLRIMETQLVPKFYECDDSKCENFTTFNKLPFDDLRRLTLYYETAYTGENQFCVFYGNETNIRSASAKCEIHRLAYDGTITIAFGRDKLSSYSIYTISSIDGRHWGQIHDEKFEYINESPTSQITHFGYVAKDIIMKKITAQGWIYNNQTFDPFTKLLAGSDESCEFYISFDEAEVKPFTIYLISDKFVHYIKVSVEDPKGIGSSCGDNPQDHLSEAEYAQLDSYRNFRIHIVEGSVIFFNKGEEINDCILQSEGPYRIVVPKDLSINVVKIAQNFLARNI